MKQIKYFGEHFTSNSSIILSALLADDTVLQKSIVLNYLTLTGLGYVGRFMLLPNVGCCGLNLLDWVLVGLQYSMTGQEVTELLL